MSLTSMQTASCAHCPEYHQYHRPIPNSSRAALEAGSGIEKRSVHRWSAGAGLVGRDRGSRGFFRDAAHAEFGRLAAAVVAPLSRAVFFPLRRRLAPPPSPLLSSASP